MKRYRINDMFLFFFIPVDVTIKVNVIKPDGDDVLLKTQMIRMY